MKVFNTFETALLEAPIAEFFIFYKGVLFPFKWKYKRKEKTVVFLPGRTDRTRKAIPVFQRASYFDFVDANAVSCFDPTLFWNENLSLAWFQGRHPVFYADLLGDLIIKIIETFKTSRENLFLYGTSGGGIPGFNIAKKIKNCNLYVSNIQTDASKYHHKHFRQMMNICYPKLGNDNSIEEIGKKISVFHIDEDFNLFFTQNKSDTFHYENHFLPYFESSFDKKNIKKRFYLYDDPSTGHEPLSKEREVAVINQLLIGKSIEDVIPECYQINQK